MSWSFRYVLSNRPSSTADGSGSVIHDITAEGSEDGGDWVNTGMHKGIAIPAAELAAALTGGTNNQKVTAYKGALADNVNTIPEPVVGWTAPILEARMDANKTAVAAADLANDFITVTLGLSYPVPFII